MEQVLIQTEEKGAFRSGQLLKDEMEAGMALV